jgi:hypothetical protein
VKEYLAGKGVSFEQRDPMVDPEAEADLARLGVSATPVTLVDGEVVVGFDREKLEQLLNA